MENHKLVGCCGLVCTECPAYIATIKNDHDLKEKTAKDWTERYLSNKMDRQPLTVDDINCLGCHSETIFEYCRVCEIRKCAIKRNNRNCGYCEDYQCDKIKVFHDKVPQAKDICDDIHLVLTSVHDVDISDL